MSLNNPIALLFAGVIPVIIALYLLRLKRRRHLISSTFFWTEMIQDLQANVPFQKLRWNILLFLQLLIALAIIFSLVDPSIKAALNEGRRSIFIVDTSASMKSVDSGKSRFDTVIEDIRRYCQSLSPREQVMLIVAGEHAEVGLEFTDNLPAIERVLDSLKPGDTRSDLTTAYALAQARADQIDQPFIVIASDFSGIDNNLFENSTYPINYLKVGEEAPNAGITDFSVPSVNIETGMVSPFVSIRNYSDNDVDCDVEFYSDGELVDVRSVEIEARSRIGRQFRDVPFVVIENDDSVLEVRLDYDDALEVDNIAYAIPQISDTMDILLAGDDDFILLALMGLPGIRLFQVTREDFEPEDQYDLVIFPGWAPENLPAGNYVFFNPPDTDYLPVTMGEPVELPKVTDWEDGHPLMRFVNPGSFNVFTARKMTLDPGTINLIDSDQTSLMAYGERNYLRMLVFPFNLTGTDLITKPTYPVILMNTVSFFRTYMRSSESGIQAQGISAVRIENLGEKISLLSPDGDVQEFPIDAGYAYVDVDETGVYKMNVLGGAGDSGESNLIVNFFDESESDINDFLPLSQVSGNTNAVRFEVEGEKRLWKWMGLSALLVLCVEWFFYHRKGF
ncbi:MAG TPA: VWA domain-containing protein [bacterium]|jgi:hypothetical protein